MIEKEIHKNKKISNLPLNINKTFLTKKQYEYNIVMKTIMESMSESVLCNTVETWIKSNKKDKEI